MFAVLHYRLPLPGAKTDAHATEYHLLLSDDLSSPSLWQRCSFE